ncbi:PRM10 [Candida theae]|uniref:Pheromone-regulated membrane protein 10 n=1 Tax=Candida theae TaxID=1198502 RepID=A0AAD5G0G1_9ASCO|nr:PRM10 [Candida theae]KAI5965085.1 PRM10 [Candida theae]
MSNDYSSSSDDENFNPNPQHQFHVQIPSQQLNLNEVRKQNQKKDNSKFTKQTSSNFNKVASKFNNKKKSNAGKFPDSYTPRDPRASLNASRSSHGSFEDTRGDGYGDSDSDSDDDEFDPGGSRSQSQSRSGDQNLPHFKFDANEIRKSQGPVESDDDDSDGASYQDQTHTDFTHIQQAPHEQFYQTDSSDDEGDARAGYKGRPESIHQDPLDKTKSGSSRKSSDENYAANTASSSSASLKQNRKPSMHSMHSHETNHSASKRSTNSAPKESSGNGAGGLRGILRKMSLADRIPSQDHDISHSDAFLGKVLSGGNQGLSGGGLAPGATRYSRDRNDDEEKRVGFADHDDRGGENHPIELQPLSKYDDLSDEVKALVDQHIPESVLHSNNTSANTSANVTPTRSTEDLLNEKVSDENKESKKRTSDDERKDNPLYAPNPDIFLRGHNDSEPDKLAGIDGNYIEPPKHVQAGVLSSLLRLYQQPLENKSASSLRQVDTNDSAIDSFDEHRRPTSHLDLTRFGTEVGAGVKYGMKSAQYGASKGYKNIKASGKAIGKAANKVRHYDGKGRGAGAYDKPLPDGSDDDSNNDNDRSGEGGEGKEKYDNTGLPSFQNAKPKMPKKRPTDPANTLKKLKRNKKAERLRITVHIADVLQRQRFIINMCRAMMLYGAPTHRLEEYMVMTSRVLEIDGQFIYFPGCMLVSFGDAATRTSEVHLVRCAQGINLGKLVDTHQLYKGVTHDLIGVEEATKKLDDLLKQKNKFSPWWCMLFYALGSLAVTPYAFDGGWADLPISFGIGLCVGFLQYYVATLSNLYANVFEVSSAIVVSFIARGIGSIRGGDLFCFSAIAQGSLAIILPGYIILTGSLELQSRNIVAGSVRMFYAIIYSLFLGFGITLGSALFGWVYHDATSESSCPAGHTIDDKWRILFVPLFASCLALVNQAKWRQLPIMVIIACIGYIATYFAGKHFSSVTEFTACIGAFIVGICGNLYSRIFKGVAVAALLPAIFVQVPSGIASKSSLISGVQTADEITNRNGTETMTTDYASSLSFGATMTEVSIGISVGLFAAALVVYPFGKKGTGLFTL